MRTLMLLRHAKSSWDQPGLDDFERPLNARGQNAATRMGRYLARKRQRPDLFLCSSALRARATCDLVQAEIDDIRVVHLDDLYLASSAKLLEACQQVEPEIETLALIGHNPGLEALALRLVGSGSARERQRMATKVPTGALAVIEFECDGWTQIGDGAGRLARFVCPKDLED